MDKRLGLFLLAFVLLAAVVPISVQAEPTRAMDAEITEVLLDGPMADGGEFAVGTHAVSIKLDNTGDEDFMQFVDFHMNITYTSNGSVYYFDMMNKVVFIASGSVATLELDDVDFIEGQFDIEVNATIGMHDTRATGTFDIMDVADLSIMNVEFEEGAQYPLNEVLVPMCNVSLWGNLEEFADTVNINLLIETIGTVSDTVYDESMEILTPASPPVAAGKYWIVLFPSWTPNASGSYKATFSVFYDTYNEENNVDMVNFSIANPPVIEGTVTSGGTPVPGVDVTVSTVPVTKTTTDEDGKYSFYDITGGSYTIEFLKMWMAGNITTVIVVPGETQVVDATMEMLEVGGLHGYVTLPNGSDAIGAIVKVEIADSTPISTTTNTEGFYEFEEVPTGNATVTASFSGYQDDVEQTNILRGTWNSIDLQLQEIPFEVTFSVPDGEPGFPIYDQISVFFTRPIMRSSVDSGSLVLRELATGDLVNTIYSFADSDMTVVMTPNPPLKYNTDYQIEVKTWIQDTNGDFFPTTVYRNFTTEFQIEEIELTSYFPANDANEVALNVVISAVFPVDMDGDTITDDTFQLSTRGGVLVDADVTYDELTRTAYLDPTSVLDYGTRYSVSLDSDILAVDESKNFLGFTWSFETEVLVTTGTLTGRVVDEDGNPFIPSAVSIKLATGTSNILTKNPDTTGGFQFIDVEEGLWTLTITVNGYETFSKDYQITAGDTTEIPEDIKMVKEKDDSSDSDIPWPFIGLIAIGVFLIIIIIFYLLNRPKEAPVEEVEERGRRFGRREEAGYYGGGYDEYAEGEFMCPVCGFVVESEETICPNCQSEFEEDLFECPECGASIPADALTCPECDAVFEEEEEGEEDEYYDEEEEVDITGEYEVEDIEEDFGIPEVE
ncbi:MAG: carboxypeptidase regulatory-like domain-containing protein [Thermoplasmatota archaeon]